MCLEGLKRPLHSESSTGELQRVIRPVRGFQTMKNATATIKGLEMIRMIRREHCLTCRPGVRNEVRFVNHLFQLPHLKIGTGEPATPT